MKKVKNSKKNKKAVDEFYINILSEKNIKYVELDMEMSQKARQLLIDHGRKNIINDEEALIDWAFTDAVKNTLKMHNKNDKS